MAKKTKKQKAKAKAIKEVKEKLADEARVEALHEAAQKVGFSKEQIATYATREDLIQAVNRVKPNTIPLIEPAIERLPKPEKEKEEKEVKTLVLDLTLTPAMAKGPMRAENENRSVKVFLARNGIRGVRRVLTCVNIHRSYEKPYHTKVTIFYKERV